MCYYILGEKYKIGVNDLDELPSHCCTEYGPSTNNTPDGNYGIVYTLMNEPSSSVGDGAQMAINVTGPSILWTRRRVNGHWSEWMNIK